MRKVTEVNRKKEVYNITSSEIRTGEWLKLLPQDNDMFEFDYKSNYLSMREAQIKSEKGEKHGTERKK